MYSRLHEHGLARVASVTSIELPDRSKRGENFRSAGGINAESLTQPYSSTDSQRSLRPTS